MVESSATALLEQIQPLSGASSVADTSAIWSAFEENSFFAVPVCHSEGESLYVPFLSALYTPGFFFAAEDAISTRSPFTAVGRSLPRLQLSLAEAELSWFAALWLPCTGDAEALLSDSLLVFYGLSPLAVLCALPYSRCSSEAIGTASALVKDAGVHVPDLDRFILSAS